jgi:general secretion pathway protein A
MYASFFGLKQEPFSIAPDPRYLFMSERHREALAHLLYGVRSGGGFVLLSGEIGAGKTTVCRCFLEQIPKRCNVAYIFNPKLTVHELLKTVCEEFRIPHGHQGPGVETVKDYLDPINEFLLKTHAVGQNNVLIIDEAQMLSAEVLEQLRLLTNLETNERKLLQIILIGQPELRDMLARPELEQLAQRVIARFHLEALSEAETAQYIRHRLGVAGLDNNKLFDRHALARIHQLTRGVPRRINLLCDRSLLGAYAEGRARVTAAVVDKAAGEVFGGALPPPAEPSAGRRGRAEGAPGTSRWRGLALGGGLGLVAGAVLFGVATVAMDRGHGTQAEAPPAVAPRAALPAAPRVAGAASASASAASSAIAAATPAAAASQVLDTYLRNEADAWRELGSLWKLALDAGDPCLVAREQQVQCFRNNGGLAQLRQLDRPAMLTLHDGNGQVAYALLTRLAGQNATLRAGGRTQTVSLVALARNWRGEFATFWRSPPGYSDKLVGGESGPVVDWLGQRLAVLHNEAPPAGGRRFDHSLSAKVAAFQQAQGLKADGMAGPMTFMQINRATGTDEPRLIAEK